MKKLNELIGQDAPTLDGEWEQRVATRVAAIRTSEQEGYRRCRRCGDTRFVRTGAKLGEEGFGAVIPCPDCGVVGLTHDERFQRMGFERIQTFAQWQPTLAMEPAMQALRELLTGERWVVFLRAGLGCGKTHLSVATAYEGTRGTTTAGLWNVPDLLDQIRRCYDDGAEQAQYDLLNSIYRRDIIVLDDLGANKPTEWANSMLYEIVDKIYRMRAERRLIVTTNVRPGDEAHEVNGVPVIEPRLLSRIMPGEVVLRNTTDRRGEFER